MSPAERHNVMAPAILRQIVDAVETEAQALVIIESVLAGAAFYYATAAGRDRRAAGEMVDHVAAGAIERIATL